MQLRILIQYGANIYHYCESNWHRLWGIDKFSSQNDKDYYLFKKKKKDN
jgi:hypothetical protein